MDCKNEYRINVSNDANVADGLDLRLCGRVPGDAVSPPRRCKLAAETATTRQAHEREVSQGGMPNDSNHNSHGKRRLSNHHSNKTDKQNMRCH